MALTVLTTTKFLLLISITICSVTYYHYAMHSPMARRPPSQCSFDNISACQSVENENRTLLFIIGDIAGFGSELNQLLLAFAYSVATKRRFLIDSRKWNYGQISDYFTLPSMMHYPDQNRTFLSTNSLQNELLNHLKTTRVDEQIYTLWNVTYHVQSLQVKRRVAHYLWKSISNETAKFIATCRITNVSDFIGVHIRRGDKLLEEARAIPLEKYVHTIRHLTRKDWKLPGVFVASDDNTLIQDLRKLQPAWHVFSVYKNHHRRRVNVTGHFQDHFNRLSKQEIMIETRLLMCELQMLSDAKYVICGMSSNVCRLVQILRHQDPSTVISLDQPWHAL